MTTAFATLRPDTMAGVAALLMTQTGLHHAPVIGLDGRLVGVVAQTDLVGAMLGDLASRGEENPALRLATAAAS